MITAHSLQITIKCCPTMAGVGGIAKDSWKSTPYPSRSGNSKADQSHLECLARRAKLFAAQKSVCGERVQGVILAFVDPSVSLAASKGLRTGRRLT